MMLKTWDKQKFVPYFCLALFVTIASIGTFSGGLWASVGIGGAILLFAAVAFLDRGLPHPDKRLLIFILIILVIAAVLNLNSSSPHLSWRVWEQCVTIFLPLILLTAPEIVQRCASQNLAKVLIPLAAASALLLGLELMCDGPVLKLLRGAHAQIYQYDRGLSYALLLAFPLMATIWRSKHRNLIIYFIACFLIPANFTASRAAKLAFVIGLVTVIAAFLKPLLMKRAMGGGLVVLILWPFMAHQIFAHHHSWIDHLPPSWQDRMEIWDYMSFRIKDRPFLGWGLGTSYTLPLGNEDSSLYRYELNPAPHPHNAVIELWVELGLPGLMMGLSFGLLCLARIGRMTDELLPFALGAFSSGLCFSLISYNFWSDSLWAAFALTGLLFAVQQVKGFYPPKPHEVNF